MKKKQTRKLKKYLKNEQGITLVALVVTIVVLLILAGVSIGTLFGNNGIITKAQEAVDRTQEGVDEEQREFENLLEQLNNIGNWTGGDTGNNTEGGNTEGGNTEGGGDTTEEPEIPVEITKSYVGYYADCDDDGTVDGVIYVDLAKGKIATGNWGDNNGAYNITPTTSGLKDYKISTKTYEGQTTPGVYNPYNRFGKKQVISPVTGSEGKDRFYVMALNDKKDESNNTTFYWFKSAAGNMENPPTATSTSFGRGKSNTTAMLEKWDNGPGDGYGTQDIRDLWRWVYTDVYLNQPWFVPSKEEWSAFGQELGINKSNYTSYDLAANYWTSSQYSSSEVWVANFGSGSMQFEVISLYQEHVRLSRTF